MILSQKTESYSSHENLEKSKQRIIELNDENMEKKQEDYQKEFSEELNDE